MADFRTWRNPFRRVQRLPTACTWAAVGLAAIGLGVAGWGVHAWWTPDTPVRASIPPAPQTTAAVPAGSEERATVTGGTSIHVLLSRMGIGGAQIDRIVKDARPVVDLTRCRPGEELTVRRDASGRATSISYRKSPLEVYRVVATPAGGWQASRETILTTRRVERISGEIANSLFQAVNDAGEKDALAIALADILAWEIDFAHEAQRGDRFTLLVGKDYVDGRMVRYGDILAAEYALEGRTVRLFSLPDGRGGLDYYNERGESARKSFLRTPLRYSRISSGFTARRLHPVTGRYQAHFAVDYAAPTGTPVWAVADGTVTGIGTDPASGRKIVLSHAGGYETLYLHLSGFAKGLRRGSRVSQQQVIGFVGTSGLSTGPHLDYRLRRHGALVNPLREEFPRAEPVPAGRRKEFDGRVKRLAEGLASPGELVAASVEGGW
jgi:murein DD-endopeptidase MepM/ murein hydrolase activator NlpD